MSTEHEPSAPDQNKLGDEINQVGREALEAWHVNRGYSLLRSGEEVKPVDWLCQDFFTKESSSLISGKPKKGKSSLIQALALGAASGTGAVPGLDRQWVFDFGGKPTPVYYLDTENSRSLVIRRLTSLAKEQRLSLDGMLKAGALQVNCLEASLCPPFLDPKRKSLDDDLARAQDWAALLKSAGVGLIVLDVMSHCYQEDPTRDELSQGFMRDFFKIVNEIKKGTGAHILLVHHQRKGAGGGQEQASGSSQMLRTPETLCSLSSLEDELNPDGDLFSFDTEGRQIAKGGRIYLQAGSSTDGVCRIFRQVEVHQQGQRSVGRPKGVQLAAALEVHSKVWLSNPNLNGKEISPAEWVRVAQTVCRASPETLKEYLKRTLIAEGKVEFLGKGRYRLLAA
jgi:hypothetical protein